MPRGGLEEGKRSCNRERLREGSFMRGESGEVNGTRKFRSLEAKVIILVFSGKNSCKEMR